MFPPGHPVPEFRSQTGRSVQNVSSRTPRRLFGCSRLAPRLVETKAWRFCVDLLVVRIDQDTQDIGQILPLDHLLVPGERGRVEESIPSVVGGRVLIPGCRVDESILRRGINFNETIVP